MGNNELIVAMTEFYTGDPRQIQHFLKVFAFAKMIGEIEGLNEKEQMILETAAIVHDIGIKPSLEKYGNCNGKNQEIEGPPVCEELLSRLGYPVDVIGRVSYLVGHHHTYTDIDGLDYQILVEADFLVNLYEGETDNHPVESVIRKIFKTEAGIRIVKNMFAPEREVKWTPVGGAKI